MDREKVNFAKMNALGNEIIVADMRERTDIIGSSLAQTLKADPSLTFDQIMSIHDPRTPGTDAYIHIINADGSLSGACGNGMRCVTAALSAESGKMHFIFETNSAFLSSFEQSNGEFTVDLGVPHFDWDKIPLSEEFADTRHIELNIGPADEPVLHSPSVVNVGNPHALFWVKQDVWSYELERCGPLIENHPLFPEGINVSLALVTAPDAITLRVWERGAGLTRACGTAAAAASVCGARLGYTERFVTVTMPGGALLVEWKDNNHILITGPVNYEFSGKITLADGAWQRETEG
ncbi:MAG: diaminopimelate epimerase [Alphaproteobacteria bacterium]|nr:diaminopimelate epimerase [Alphaproteobacteria bacterium]